MAAAVDGAGMLRLQWRLMLLLTVSTLLLLLLLLVYSSHIITRSAQTEETQGESA